MVHPVVMHLCVPERQIQKRGAGISRLSARPRAGVSDDRFPVSTQEVGSLGKGGAPP